MTLSGIEAKIYAELATINRYGEDIHKTVTIKFVGWVLTQHH